MKTKFRIALCWLLRICIGLLLLGIFGTVAVFWLLQSHPEQLANFALQEIRAKTGLDCDFATLDVSLTPLPALSFSDVKLAGSDLELEVAWLAVMPDFYALMRGEFAPARITAVRPRLSVKTHADLTAPAGLMSKFSPLLASGGGEVALPGSFQLRIDYGSIRIEGLPGQSFTMWGVRCELGHAWGKSHALASVRGGRLAENDIRLAAYHGLYFTGELGGGPAPQFEASVKTALRIPGKLAHGNVESRISGTFADWTGSAQLSGGLVLGSEEVPFKLAGDASQAAGNPLALRNIDWALGADSGSLNASLTFPAGGDVFDLAGVLTAHRFSLPEWLGVARNFPPGIQLALDNILNARLVFTLNSHSLSVPSMQAESTGAIFSGSGGVPDFSHPTVMLDLRAPYVNLGLALPEAVIKLPDPPAYSHPPLLPFDNTPLEEGEEGIGYDVRLGAARLKYGPMDLTDASVRIYPGKLDTTQYRDILLSGAASVYGGGLTGECILGADPSMPVYIKATAANVKAAPIAKTFSGVPVRQGILSYEAVVTSRGKTLKLFLANLKGDLSLKGTKLGLPGLSGNAATLDATGKLRSASATDRDATFDGIWKARLRNAGLDGSATVDGRIVVSNRGVAMGNAKASASLTLPKGSLRPDKPVSVSGRLRVSTAAGEYSLTQAQGQAFGASARGEATYSAKKDEFKGKIELTLQNLQSSLRQLSFSQVNIPPQYNSVKLNTDFSGNFSSLSLSRLSAACGQSTLAGRFHWEKRNRPYMEFSLTMNKFQLAARENDKQPPAEKWNLEFLRTFDGQGTLNVTEMELYKLHLANVRLPMQLNAGKLRLGPCMAAFYGAPVRADGTADFGSGLKFSARVSVHEFNLASATRDREMKGELTGTATLDADITADAPTPKALAGALNGRWRLQAANGRWQARTAQGEPDGSPTEFSRISASGTMKDGIVYSDDLALKGPKLTMNGKGWLNLVSQQMDCDLNVDFSGLPEIPVHITGSISNPKTHIGAGKLFINVIVGLATGVVDILGGILGGIWNLFH